MTHHEAFRLGTVRKLYECLVCGRALSPFTRAWMPRRAALRRRGRAICLRCEPRG